MIIVTNKFIHFTGICLTLIEMENSLSKNF